MLILLLLKSVKERRRKEALALEKANGDNVV